MAEQKRYFGEPFPQRPIDADGNYIDIVHQNSIDGSTNIHTDIAQYNGKVNTDVNNIFKDATSEAEMIQAYRDISEHQDVDFAIEEIVNEIFVTDGVSKPIEINLENVDIHKTKKKIIQDEFNYILRLLNFSTDAFDIFKKFYIDSRLYYYKQVDPTNLEGGITELRQIDPISIRKVREYITRDTTTTDSQKVTEILDTKEYFVFTPQNNAYGVEGGGGFGALNSTNLNSINTTAYKLNAYSVAYVDSGIFDYSKNCIKGHLSKAIKPLNDLLNMETSMIVYRLARASERRIFYIDTANLPPQKAQQYINAVQDSYRREVNYDSSTGKVSSDTKAISMHEDFWLPRSSTGKGTEVDTLSGASNLSAIEDIEYTDKKLKRALNIPMSRFDNESPAANVFGINTEMAREEIKFQKFIGRLRSKFNKLFLDILETQVITKRILTVEEWKEFEDDISFDYVKDAYLQEARKFSVLQQKADVAKDMAELEGKYLSRKYIWETVLGLAEDGITEMKEQIAAEKKEYGDEEDSF